MSGTFHNQIMATATGLGVPVCFHVNQNQPCAQQHLNAEAGNSLPCPRDASFRRQGVGRGKAFSIWSHTSLSISSPLASEVCPCRTELVAAHMQQALARSQKGIVLSRSLQAAESSSSPAAVSCGPPAPPLPSTMGKHQKREGSHKNNSADESRKRKRRPLNGDIRSERDKSGSSFACKPAHSSSHQEDHGHLYTQKKNLWLQFGTTG